MDYCNRESVHASMGGSAPRAAWEIVTRWGTEGDVGKIKLCGYCASQIVSQLLGGSRDAQPETINLVRLSDG